MDLFTESLLFGVARWIHFVSIAVAIGGAFALRYYVLPAVGELEDLTQARFHERVRKGAFKVVVAAVVLIFLSGLVNLMRALSVGATPPPAYHMIFGIKFLMAMVIFVAAIGLVAPSQSPNMFQRKRRMWLTMNVHLGIVIIAMSVALKFLSGK